MTARPDLASIYAAVPDAECKGLCQDECTVLAVSPAERVRLDQIGAQIITPDDVTYEEIRDTKVTCPMLVFGRCSIYRDRPLICRLYAVAESLPCPHGCRPAAGRISDNEATMLIAASWQATP